MGAGSIRRIERIVKVDDELGIVFGWAIVCKILNPTTQKFEPYFDTQGDHIPDDVMLKAVTDFARNSRGLDEMHVLAVPGAVRFSMPVTEEIAKSSGGRFDKTGWWVGVEPDAARLQKFKSGEYGGFSINGSGVRELASASRFLVAA